MKFPLAATCFVIGTALTPLAAQAVDSDTAHPKAFVKDSVITTKIKAKLASEHLTSATRINVDTDNNGVVYLSGTAINQTEADKAVTIARNTEGVKSVNSELKVQAN